MAAALGVDAARMTTALAAMSATAQAATAWPGWRTSAVPDPPAGQPDTKADGNGGPAARVRLGVLGPLAAWRDGAPLALGPVRQRTVLGVLAVRPNSPVHRDVIGQALWGETQPATAITMIQSYVSQLRRALSGGSAALSPLASAGPAYRLLATEDDLDLLLFARLLQAARDASTGDDAAQALDLYQQALTVWRGEALADLDVLHGDPAVVGLNRQRAAAVVECAGVAVAMGAHEPVIAPLQALADRERLNERAHACLMIALAGCGQQAAALDIYDKLRWSLDDQLGVRPGREVTDAHVCVLRGTIPGQAQRHPARRPALGLAEAGSSGATGRTAVPPVWPVCQLPAATADFTRPRGPDPPAG
jgi:DNA-binding SARP family transcriptional activator